MQVAVLWLIMNIITVMLVNLQCRLRHTKDSDDHKHENLGAGNKHRFWVDVVLSIMDNNENCALNAATVDQ